MGFKNPKTSKSVRDPYDDGTEHDFDPTATFTGGRRVSKKKLKRQGSSDAPKSFQYIMDFMDKKQQKDANDRKARQAEAKKKKKRQQDPANAPRAITEKLKIMPNETMAEFNRRVRQKMETNMQLIGTDYELKEATGSNPSKDDGEATVVSKRPDRKRRHDAIRKERKLAKKRKNGDDYELQKSVEAPRFGEQAQAPPIFKSLPKEKFKKMVPLPNSKEEADDKKRRADQAVKTMIQRTARLSPLERMQARRKAKQQGDTAAEKRIIEAERERAVRRYRMLRATQESAKKLSV
ncbi:hypothetical protein H4S02_000418 [Coemansia sp. RSA 2611]|nr:hypothetical protein H4S02_000418 [Coemansia sp. RSA 2611]